MCLCVRDRKEQEITGREHENRTQEARVRRSSRSFPRNRIHMRNQTLIPRTRRRRLESTDRSIVRWTPKRLLSSPDSLLSFPRLSLLTRRLPVCSPDRECIAFSPPDDPSQQHKNSLSLPILCPSHRFPSPPDLLTCRDSLSVSLSPLPTNTCTQTLSSVSDVASSFSSSFSVVSVRAIVSHCRHRSAWFDSASRFRGTGESHETTRRDDPRVSAF